MKIFRTVKEMQAFAGEQKKLVRSSVWSRLWGLYTKVI